MIALTALALAGRPLSAHVLAWCVSRGRLVRPGVVFIVTMTPIALGGIVAGATIRLVPDEFISVAVHALIGLGLGGLFVLAECSLTRYVHPMTRPARKANSVDERLHTDPPVARAGGIAQIYCQWSSPQKLAIARPWALPELCLVAILEEILYRGIVSFAALRIGVPATSISLLVVSAVLFGLSHDAFGTHQIILKTTYAIVLTGATLLTGSLLPAIVGHLVINVFSWAQNQRWMRAVETQKEVG